MGKKTAKTVIRAERHTFAENGSKRDRLHGSHRNGFQKSRPCGFGEASPRMRERI